MTDDSASSATDRQGLDSATARAREPGTVTLVWFRDDLRVSDNPALTAAVERGEPIVAAYVLDETSAGIRPLGGASKWWLHHSLLSLTESLAALGIPIVFLRGSAAVVIADARERLNAGAVYWNRRYGPAERELDTGIKSALTDSGVEARSFSASLLFEPWQVQTGSGGPYRVFTPFWRSYLAGPEPRHPLGTVGRLPEDDTAAAHAALVDAFGPAGRTDAGSPVWPLESLAPLDLLPTAPDWSAGLAAEWTPGESGAAERLSHFLQHEVATYPATHDLPAQRGTSGLSPHLRFGEISPSTVWHTTRRTTSGEGPSAFLRQLVWRDFSYHLYFHNPDIGTENMRPAFDAFPWSRPDPDVLRAWQSGTTGIPLVDAGMRELWRTGIMHNRVRMVAASFLIKNLMIDWRIGEAWFWDTLVDADPAANAVNWQWVAGTGVDSAPYFRVFNPVLQAGKFDPLGEYIRQNVPEWGTDAYPEPMVDLAESRRAALAAYSIVNS